MTKYFTKNESGEYEEVEALSQSEVDNIVKTRLERQKESQFGDYEELKAKVVDVDKITKEFEDKLNEATEKATNLEGELAQAKLDISKTKIMSEFKLDEDMSEFVIGDNEDEMRKRAEKLSKHLPTKSLDIKKSDKKGNPNPNRDLAKKLFSVSE